VEGGQLFSLLRRPPSPGTWLSISVTGLPVAGAFVAPVTVA